MPDNDTRAPSPRIRGTGHRAAGRDDGTIGPVDVNGAAVVTVKAPHRLVLDLRGAVRGLEARLGGEDPE
ncbi:hypothetical protein [Streptomyces sp. NPDC005890]|uniref:hypothetical protein n=1 Tax=Streptomyces sp. NPDC005890 TaxID=3154568 RepID=UPI0033DCED87